MNARYDAVVVGGGLVGTTAAYELGRSGARTLLVDRDDAGRATDAGAGILSLVTASRGEPGWDALAAAGARYHEELAARLGGATGWARTGTIVLATRESDVPAWESVAARGGAGRTVAPDAREIDADAARALVPVLAEPVRALHDPAAARVDGRVMLAALRDAARAEGVELRRGDAVADADDALRAAGVVIVAGGAWSARTADRFGFAIPVRPVRGQIVHLGVPGHDTACWPIVQPVFGFYMVPWSDRRVAVGATVEEAGFAPEVTAGGVHEVLRETLRVMPGLAGAAFGEVRVGLRPVCADDRPALGALPGTDRVFVATGHGANGLLLGPVSGAAVAALALGADPGVDLTPFAPARFA